MGKTRHRSRESVDAERRTRKVPMPWAPANGTMRSRMALLAIVAIATLFRATYLIQYRASPFFDTPFFDSYTYDQWARRIIAGELVSAEPFYFAPGYAYALAAVYRFVSQSLVAVYILQSILGLLDVILIYHLTAAAFGRRVAPVAAALAALYAPFPFFETKPMSPTLAVTLLLLALVALASAQRVGGARRWAVAGALLGAASLVRPETLLVAPLLLLWIWRWATAPLRDAAWIVLAWGTVIAPVAIHNVRSGGGLTLISSQAAITFYQANNPRANGLYVQLVEEGFSGHPRLQAAEEKQIAEKALGRPLTRSEVSAYWFARGLSFIREQPGHFLWLLGMKLVRFLGSYEYSTEYNLQVERETMWLLWLPCVPFALLAALAVPAIARDVRDPAGGLNATGWLLLLVIAANLLTILIFYVSSRYRLPSVPPLIAFAAATLVALADGLRRRRKEAYVTATLVAVLFVALHAEKDASSVFQEANDHFNLASGWARKREDERAVAEYRRALGMVASHYDYWYGLANSLYRLRRWNEAAEAFGEAASRRPGFFEARALQGLMQEEKGDWSSAREAYEQAERLRPDDFEVQLRLGRAAARLGDRAAAVRHLDRALTLQPDSVEAHAERARL